MIEYFIGVDPGKSGGIAAIGCNRDEIDWFENKRGREEMSSWLCHYDIFNSLMLIEKVRSSPQMGVVSAFTFGQQYEMPWSLGTAYNMVCDEVTPQVWQKGLGIPPRKKKGKGEETKPQFKERLRRKAKQLFPGLELWQGTLGTQRAVCDALLIAEFLRRREVGK